MQWRVCGSARLPSHLVIVCFVSGVWGGQSFDHTGMTGVCEHIQDKTNISRAHHVFLQHDHAHNVRCVHPILIRTATRKYLVVRRSTS